MGTLVADDIAELAALGLAERPWVGADLAGLLDFASFRVPPGTRRGVAPDQAAVAFVDALEATLRPLVLAELDRLEAQRRAAVDRDVVRELQRALKGLDRRLPQYELPAVQHGRTRGEARDASEGASLASPGGASPSPASEPLELFPPGPLVEAGIAPNHVRVAPGAERRVRGVARDAGGRTIEGAVWSWQLLQDDTSLSLRGEGARPALVASPDARLGSTARLELEVLDPRSGARALASATVGVAEDGGGSDLGVPEPNLLSDPDGRWRSRLVGGRWEVNDAHPDYLSLRAEPRSRVRYLLALLAKEIVVRTTGRADAADVLESLVEVLSYAERNLRGA
jgi:hypothetical protein